MVGKGREGKFLRYGRIFDAVKQSSEIERIIISSGEFLSYAFPGLADTHEYDRSPMNLIYAVRYIEILVFPLPCGVGTAIAA